MSDNKDMYEAFLGVVGSNLYNFDADVKPGNKWYEGWEDRYWNDIYFHNKVRIIAADLIQSVQDLELKKGEPLTP